MEKSASLYDRVTALRNAANDKLESLRSDSIADEFRTAAGDLSTSEYYLPVSITAKQSDYARSRAAKRTGSDSVSQSATSKYISGEMLFYLYKWVMLYSTSYLVPSFISKYLSL